MTSISAGSSSSDTSLWLHNKLGTSNDSWIFGSIASQLSAEILLKIRTCFPDLQPQVKLKMLLSIFSIPPRNLEAWKTELHDIFELALMDSEPWVAMTAEILKHYPSSGMLNNEIEVPEGNRKIFHDLLSEVKRALKKSTLDQNISSLMINTSNIEQKGLLDDDFKDHLESYQAMLPLEARYLNKNAFISLVGSIQESSSHFSLKRKPKANSLKNELLARSNEITNKNSASKHNAHSQNLVHGGIPGSTSVSSFPMRKNTMPRKASLMPITNNSQKSKGFSNAMPGGYQMSKSAAAVPATSNQVNRDTSFGASNPTAPNIGGNTTAINQHGVKLLDISDQPLSQSAVRKQKRKIEMEDARERKKELKELKSTIKLEQQQLMMQKAASNAAAKKNHELSTITMMDAQRASLNVKVEAGVVNRLLQDDHHMYTNDENDVDMSSPNLTSKSGGNMNSKMKQRNVATVGKRKKPGQQCDDILLDDSASPHHQLPSSRNIKVETHLDGSASNSNLLLSPSMIKREVMSGVGGSNINNLNQNTQGMDFNNMLPDTSSFTSQLLNSTQNVLQQQGQTVYETNNQQQQVVDDQTPIYASQLLTHQRNNLVSSNNIIQHQQQGGFIQQTQMGQQFAVNVSTPSSIGVGAYTSLSSNSTVNSLLQQQQPLSLTTSTTSASANDNFNPLHITQPTPSATGQNFSSLGNQFTPNQQASTLLAATQQHPQHILYQNQFQQLASNPRIAIKSSPAKANANNSNLSVLNALRGVSASVVSSSSQNIVTASKSSAAHDNIQQQQHQTLPSMNSPQFNNSGSDTSVASLQQPERQIQQQQQSPMEGGCNQLISQLLPQLRPVVQQQQQVQVGNNRQLLSQNAALSLIKQQGAISQQQLVGSSGTTNLQFQPSPSNQLIHGGQQQNSYGGLSNKQSQHNMQLIQQSQVHHTPQQHVQQTQQASNAAPASSATTLTLTKDQMLEAQEMFRTANKVTRPEKALILGFMAGSRDNPCPNLGNVVTIKLSEDQEQVLQQDGSKTIMDVETHFQMNYSSGEWKRIKKYRRMGSGSGGQNISGIVR